MPENKKSENPIRKEYQDFLVRKGYSLPEIKLAWDKANETHSKEYQLVKEIHCRDLLLKGRI